MSTLYERLGGDAAVDAAVDRFYTHVMADDRISSFFEGIDMEKQAAKQKAFMTYAFGGPNKYSGRAMRIAHAKMVEDQGLNDSHFDAVAENLQKTLQELGIAEDMIGEAMAIVGSTREDVLGRN